MSIRNKLAQRKAWLEGVQHCTFDPEGPGVVRIHLIPPKFRLFGNPEYIVILNGYYLLPLGYSWALMLSAFMREVNAFDGREIGEEDELRIYANTVKAVSRVYPMADKQEIRDDLDELLDVIFAVAKGGETDVEIEKLSVRAYAKNMTAPHRMDLMISAMTDESGAWKCNQKCRFCYAAGQPLGKAKELTTDQWKTAIDKLRAAGVPMLTFTGGEPTLRNDLTELIDYSRWFITRLNTNGVALTEDLVQSLKQASLDSLQITLYSYCADIHNQLVGCGRFEETVAGIKRAVAAGLDVSINTPLCHANADYIKTLEFINSLGVRYVTVSGLICTGGAETGHELHDLSSEELYEILKEAKAYCDSHGMEIDFTSPGLIPKEKLEELSMNVPACGAALSNMAIAPDGTVIPCQSWLNADAGLGNILEGGFDTIWKHEACVKLRKMSEDEAIKCPFREGSV